MTHQTLNDKVKDLWNEYTVEDRVLDSKVEAKHIQESKPNDDDLEDIELQKRINSIYTKDDKDTTRKIIAAMAKSRVK